MTDDIGNAMFDFADELYPVCRSITGDGVRQTLRRMQREIPLEINEVASGTRVFDWEIPLEWNIASAWIEDSDGRRIVDFADSNLHVVSYSEPIDGTMDLEELANHLHVDSRNPEWTPYRTSYYSRNWGFCAAQRVRASMKPGNYRVKIDSTLEKGSLTYGELFVPGRSSTEILVYSHTCHPSLANDNLSGLAVTTWLAKHLLEQSNRYSFRFVWGPGTIGSITWLARNEARLNKIRHAMVCCLLGRPGAIHYKKTPSGFCDIDELVASVLSRRQRDAVILDFDPYGYDERQFSSPGIGLPTGRVTRLANDQYPEYHSSADNMSLIEPDTLGDSLQCLKDICGEINETVYYRNTAPKGEPQLGKRELYNSVGGQNPKQRQVMMLWLLSQSNGYHSLQRIARRAGVKTTEMAKVAQELVNAGLLVTADADLAESGK